MLFGRFSDAFMRRGKRVKLELDSDAYSRGPRKATSSASKLPDRLICLMPSDSFSHHRHRVLWPHHANQMLSNTILLPTNCCYHAFKSRVDQIFELLDLQLQHQ